MTSGSSTPVLSQQRAKEFADKWQHTKEEERYAKSFWTDFFRQLCGVDDEKIAGIEFEYPVQSVSTGRKNRIDVYWKNTVLIEHKSKGEDLDRAELQARGYLRSLPKGYQPKTLIICDFATFRIIDVRQNRTQEFLLKDLPKHINKFKFIISGNRPQFLEDEIEVDQKAAKLMANLYIELEKNNYGGHETSVFLSRLLFLLFGDDTNMWEHNLVKKILFATAENGSDVGETLSELFEFLNTSDAKRKKSEKFKDLPYINGGIFAENIQVIKFNKGMRAALIDAANYDWSGINPTIFGALFQLIKSKEERAALGEHYTSEENINKIIYPLFLDNLQERLTDAWSSKKELRLLRQHLGKIKLLDPACGCGNFLVVAYKHLRQFELELIARLQELEGKESDIGLDGTFGLSISLNQFYGIEIEEWPSQVARVAMFLTDHQENMRLEKITGAAPQRFPLNNAASIIQANALQVDWSSLVKIDENTFILGNPPFIGARMKSQEQKEDTLCVWGNTKGSGDIDYVGNWFVVAASFVKRHNCKYAFVATNSLSQGEQPVMLWNKLNEFGVRISFAYTTFKWQNDSKDAAAVHCIIVGIASLHEAVECTLWVQNTILETLEVSKSAHINGYLVHGPHADIQSRSNPIVRGIPRMDFGSMPNDGGFLSKISEIESNEIRRKDKVASKFIRRLIGAQELIDNENRFCLWLVDASPSDIANSSVLKERVRQVKQLRLASKRKATQRLADKPAEFGEIRQPTKTYLAVPGVSSETRKYIPMAYFEKEVIASNSLLTISGAPLWLFAILESKVFTVWNSIVSGRLESRFRISAEITYNNFPFVPLEESQIKLLENSAKKILETRESYTDSSLAELYGPVSMPKNLVKIHEENDKLVLDAFGLSISSTDNEILNALFLQLSKIIDQRLPMEESRDIKEF